MKKIKVDPEKVIKVNPKMISDKFDKLPPTAVTSYETWQGAVDKDLLKEWPPNQHENYYNSISTRPRTFWEKLSFVDYIILGFFVYGICIIVYGILQFYLF